MVNKSFGDWIVDNVFLFQVILLIVFYAVAILFMYFSCGNKWAEFPNRYKLIGGCQIQVKDKWIPADSYYFKED